MTGERSSTRMPRRRIHREVGATTRIVIHHLHPGPRGKSEEAGEAEGQADTPRSAAGRTGAATRPHEAGFRVVPTRGTWADRGRQGRAAGGRGGTRGPGRPGCHPGHRMAGDCHPARRDQAGSSPALPTPPPRQNYQVEPSCCKQSSGTVNVCCQTSAGSPRLPTAFWPAETAKTPP